MKILPHLAAWSERVQAGESIDDANEAVQHHLSICRECNEEFKVLTEILGEGTSREDPGSSTL